MLIFNFLLPVLTLASDLDGVRIEGGLNMPTECAEAAEIFLVHDKSILAQISVPADGDFEFQVLPGDYQLAGVAGSKCQGTTTFHVEKNSDTLSVNLRLQPERQPAQFAEAGFQWAPANFAIPPYLGMARLPPWAYYGATYPNFYYPGMWNNGGLVSNAYPGAGNVGFDKPNLYLSSTKKRQVTVQINYKNPQAKWLSAVPTYKKNGWHVTTTGHNRIQADRAKYNFLYYDFRGDDRELQSSSGFCAPRGQAIDLMLTLLKGLKFKKNEIADFSDYWRIKMPPYKDLCVYPQTQSQMDQIANIQVKPKPRLIQRMLFVVVPRDEKKFYGAGKFERPPTSAWRAPASAAVINYSSDLEVHEWGVAFLFTPPQK